MITLLFVVILLTGPEPWGVPPKSGVDTVADHIQRIWGLEPVPYDNDPESDAYLRCAGDFEVRAGFREHWVRRNKLPEFFDVFGPNYNAVARSGYSYLLIRNGKYFGTATLWDDREEPTFDGKQSVIRDFLKHLDDLEGVKPGEIATVRSNSFDAIIIRDKRGVLMVSENGSEWLTYKRYSLLAPFMFD